MILRTLWAAVISDHCLRFDLKPTECICTVLWGACKTTHLSHRCGGNLASSSLQCRFGSLRFEVWTSTRCSSSWEVPSSCSCKTSQTPDQLQARCCRGEKCFCAGLVFYKCGALSSDQTSPLWSGLSKRTLSQSSCSLLCCCLVFREERFLQGNPSNTAMLVQSFSDFTVMNFILYSC